MDKFDAKVAAEARSLIAEVEEGRTAHAAWLAIRDRLEILADGRTQKEVGEMVERKKGWVGRVLTWDPKVSDSPFARNASKSREAGIRGAEAKRALLESPEKVAKVIAEAPAKVQRAFADALIAADAERSLRSVVRPHTRPERKAPSPEDKLGSALFLLWESGELLLDYVPGDEERVRMVGQLEKIERLTAGVRRVIDTGDLDAEFEALVDEMSRS